MRAVAKGLVATVAIVVAVTLGACATPSGSTPQAPAGMPAVHPAWTSCATDAPEGLSFSSGGAEVTTLPRLGDRFVPAAVVVCSAQPARRPDGGEDLVATESRADDVAALVAALRLPDQPRTLGACTMELPIVAWFALLDETGQWLRPGAPVDPCGKIRIEVREAVGQLKLTRISGEPIAEIESSAAAATGCSQTWADIVSVELGRKPVPKRSALAYPLAGATQIRLCAYRVPLSEQGSGKPAGTFDYGGMLTPLRRASIEKALALSGPVKDCSAHAGRFALLRSSDNIGGDVYVELDGCQRILANSAAGPSTVAQADPTLSALLEKQ